MSTPNKAHLKSMYTSIYPWVVWIFAAGFFFYKNLLEVSPSVMSTDFMSAFHLSGAGVGNLAACYFYAYLIMQIPVGLLTDRIGPRKITTISILFCVIGSAVLAKADTVFMAGVGRFLTGIGAAVAAIACLKLITIWFSPKHFAVMAGLMMTVGMMGAVGGQAPLTHLIAKVGWRQALIWISMVGVFLSVIYWVVVRDKYEIKQAAGLQLPKVKVKHALWKILRNPETWYLSIFSGLAYSPVSAFGGLWGVPFIQAASHMTKVQAAAHISFIFIGFAIGGPIIGWLSDKRGVRLPFMKWGMFFAFVILSLMVYLPYSNVYLSSMLMLLFGIAVSSFMLSFSMIREVNSILVAATAIGVMNTFDAGLGAITDPFVGKLLDWHWTGMIEKGARVYSVADFHIAMLVLPIYLLFAFGMLFLIKETHGKVRD